MPEREINRILVIRSDRFGEFLLNIPALRVLRKAYPRANITLAVSPAVKELALALECVDEVEVWNKAFRRAMRGKKFDACIVLNPAKEAHWAAFWAGIPVRAGYDRKWGFLLTHKIKDEKYLGLRHEVEYNLELVRLVLPLASALPRNDEGVSIRVAAKCDLMIGGKIVAIHPFTSDPVKQWPVDRFMELAGRISRELGVKVIFVGKTGDGRGIKRNAENLGALDLVNKTSLTELACVLKRCSMLVTCDSGPMHLAAAVGTPVIALFRNDLPGKTAKRWGPVGKGHTVIERDKLENINASEIFEAVRRVE